MNYYELTFELSPNTEINRDILAGVLSEIEFESFTESENGINAYVSEKFHNKSDIETTLANFPIENVSFKYTSTLVKTKNWNEEWEKHFFQPIIIEDQCIIHSSFHKDIPSLPFNIVIDPKMAFGTGHHETTSLMISYLLQINLENKSFLDMGCGTAILAILAKMKNAKSVVAIDIDEWAYNNALENITHNNTTNIKVLLGNAELLNNDTFDVIFANINRNILIEDIPSYTNCLESGSSIYMSGFYIKDIPAIKETCINNKLTFVDSKNKNDWAAVHFIKE